MMGRIERMRKEGTESERNEQSILHINQRWLSDDSDEFNDND